MITKSERPINIKDLVIEEPKVMDEIAPFSIKRDIDEQNYQAMVKFLNNRFMLRWSEDTGETACNLYTLFPQRREDFIKDNSLSDTLLDWIRPGDSERFRYKYFLKTVFPDVYDQFPVNKKLFEERWTEIMKNIGEGNQGSLDLEDLVCIKALDQDLVVSKEQKKNLEDLVPRFNRATLANQVRKAVVLKVLSPELFDKLNITDDFWKNNREYLNFLKKENRWLDFVKRVYQLNIISAQEIKFQNGEMVIVPPVDLKEVNVVPLPETRRF